MKNIILLLFLFVSITTSQKSFSNSFESYPISNSNWDRSKNEIEIKKEGDRLFLKLTPESLNIDMLFINHGIKSPSYEIIKWVKKADEILMVKPPVKTQVGDIILNKNNDVNTTDLILDKFKILRNYESIDFYQIDISSLFINVPKGLPGSHENVISRLSFIEEIYSSENEIIISTTRTTINSEFQDTHKIDFSIVILPTPMNSRLFDNRMGFFMDTGILSDYSVTPNAAITRFRLRKKNPEDSISDPIQPIIFYYDFDTPEIWKPYIKAGIEEWLPAFEAAGYSNALKVMEIPNKREKHELNSINYNIIRWDDREGYRNLTSTGTASVYKIIDLRSGEILKADIFISSKFVLQEFMEWYIVRAAPLDAEARTYPIGNERLGEIIQSVTAHEAGHAFGIMDGNYGEYTYPFEKMRSEEWLTTMGHSPSVINYARFNNLIQPEDNIPPKLLMQKVGPTDIYNIQYGYTEFIDIDSPKDELEFLEKIIRRQDSIPWFKINRGNPSIIGPDSTNEVVDNNDPVKSASLALKNLKRTFKLLPEITKHQKDDAALIRLYDLSNNLWKDEMKQVLSLIGGFTSHYKSGSQEGPVYSPIIYEKQMEAIGFLVFHAFNNAKFLYHPTITQRMGADMSVERISSLQSSLLFDLLSSDRLKRLEETEILLNQPYLTEDILSKLQSGLWMELYKKEIKIDPFKMELQMAYLDIVSKIIGKEGKKYELLTDMSRFKFRRYTDQCVSSIFSQLLLLETFIKDSLKKSKDDTTLAHLKLCSKKIEKIINI